MTFSMKRLLAGAVLVVTPMFAACERAGDISSVSDIRPSYDANGVNNKRSAKLVRTTTAAANVNTGYAYVTPGLAARIVIGKFELYIPRGAVKHPTTFKMTATEGGLISVQLDAYEFNNPNLPITQFKNPLKLTMPYGSASEEFLAAPGNWVIANISEDGLETILELVNVSVDRQNQTMTGAISHFSTYAVAKEIIIGID